jgi:release factor glutamine methyltransferase
VVTAAELSGQALRGLQLNRDALSSHIRIFRSDVLDQVPPQPYDFIVINPPYFPKAVNEEWELSWYCGEHHEFFIRLFSKLIEFVHGETRVLMVLSEDCDIFTITKLARRSGWDVAECARKKIWLEWNYIFECRRHLVQPPSQHD